MLAFYKNAAKISKPTLDNSLDRSYFAGLRIVVYSRQMATSVWFNITSVNFLLSEGADTLHEPVGLRDTQLDRFHKNSYIAIREISTKIHL